MIPVEGSSRLIRWVVSMPPGAGSERSMRMMSGDVSRARSIARPAVVGLADDLEVGLALEDVADADAEQGVVVDDQDRGPFPVRSSIGAAPSAFWSAIAHQLVSSAPTGIASRTSGAAVGP